jgi:endonuclease III related protein
VTEPVAANSPLQRTRVCRQLRADSGHHSELGRGPEGPLYLRQQIRIIVHPVSKLSPEAMVRAIYRTLARSWGPQYWWPAESVFEVITGAILTQNTSWNNVERALNSLRAAGALNIKRIRELPIAELEQLVRSSGYFRQKASRLKQFVAYLDEKHGGSLDKMLQTPTPQLRDELLALKGIGPETADAILLYAGHHEVFVVDAYARRILERHEAISVKAKYDEVRSLVERALQKQETLPYSPQSKPTAPTRHEPSVMSMAERSRLAQVYNEMHGLLVQVGKHYCFRVDPDCPHCPLLKYLPDKEAFVRTTT